MPSLGFNYCLDAHESPVIAMFTWIDVILLAVFTVVSVITDDDGKALFGIVTYSAVITYNSVCCRDFSSV